jgi:flagellin-like hook-associated protein FlgL
MSATCSDISCRRRAKAGVLRLVILWEPNEKRCQANDQAGIQVQLDPLNQNLNWVLNARADVGAKMNRLEAQEGRLTEVSDQLTQRLGETEGTDLAEAISGFT